MNQNYNQQPPAPSDNSGMGVVLGVIIAVLIAVGGYFFMQSQGMIGSPADTTTVNIEAPSAAEPAAGTPEPAPAPAP